MTEKRRTLYELNGLRARLAEEAHRQIGKPYVYGARWQDAPKEFDCSSLVQYLYKKTGISIPRVSIDQAREGRSVRSEQKLLKTGDLIFIRAKSGRYDRRFPCGIGHVYIVTGPNEVVHAKYRKIRGKDAGSVIRQRLSTIMKRDDITTIRRIL